MTLKILIAVGLSALLLTTGLSSIVNAEDISSAITEAVSSPDRKEEDLVRDADRKPDQILNFFGVEPGMVVFEHTAGAGYYTDLLSAVVGPEGKVIAQNGVGFKNRLMEGWATRYPEGRPGNVEELIIDPASLSLKEETVDLALIILGFHHYSYDEISGEEVLAPAGREMLKELYDSLKPGAHLGILDHWANEETPRSLASEYHRLVKTRLIDDVLSTGYEFVAETDILRNSTDPGEGKYWEVMERGKTDRFVLLFRKPE